MRLKTLENKLRYRIRRSKAKVFLPNDFSDLGGRDQVARALRSLISNDEIIKIGYGLYAKASYSTLLKKSLPAASIPDLAREALDKLGIPTALTIYEKLYNERKSTQVPSGRVIGVKERISRKISYGATDIVYERVAQ